MATILTIDDSCLAHHAVRLALGRVGHELSWARDGIEGVEEARERHPDVIVLGLSLPAMGGISVLRVLRGEGIDAPAIVIGTGVSEWTRSACAELGVVGFVDRPVCAPTMRHEIERALGQSGGERSAA